MATVISSDGGVLHCRYCWSVKSNAAHLFLISPAASYFPSVFLNMPSVTMQICVQLSSIQLCIFCSHWCITWGGVTSVKLEVWCVKHRKEGDSAVPWATMVSHCSLKSITKLADVLQTTPTHTHIDLGNFKIPLKILNIPWPGCLIKWMTVLTDKNIVFSLVIFLHNTGLLC